MSLTTVRRATNPGTKLQRGQALLFALVFSISAALVSLLLFNSGMLANSKTRLQNAADAGAYSAGVLQARDHNFSAYTNRAMVANQVAVVQLASLKSYLEDAANTHQRMGGWLLSTEAMLPADKPAWDFALSYPIEDISQTFNNAASGLVTGLDSLIDIFQTAQEAHHQATAFKMVLVADEVVKRNDANAGVSTGTFTVGQTQVQVQSWKNYTLRHSSNDATAIADRFADVVVSQKSTDEFTRDRSSDPVPVWASQVRVCSMLPNYIWSFTAFKFNHSGGSILSADKKRWLALDASQGGGVSFCSFWVPCGFTLCPFTEINTLFDDNFVGGSGGAVAGTSGDYGSQTGYKNNPASTANYGRALTNPGTMIPAGIRYNDGPGGTLDSRGGLQDFYRDVGDPVTSIPIDQAPENNGGAVVTIEVERLANSIVTSSKVMPNSTLLKINDGLKSDTMRTLSSAHAYFYRSSTDDSNIFTRQGWGRSDGKTELANLFNPYWQARLVDRSQADRAASWAAH
jgi:hypothetical protein